MNRLLMVLLELVRIPVLAIWRWRGWAIETDLPDIDKFVALGVPHTSMEDYWNFLMIALTMRRRPFVTMKRELFALPMGPIFRLLGGIPIDRDKSSNLTDQIADIFAKRKRMIMVFSVEGSRKYTDYWRTGFYYTALQAHVPIACAYIDYPRKRMGFGLVLEPTGNLDADFEKIKAFYEVKGRQGKHPDQVSQLALKPRPSSEKND